VGPARTEVRSRGSTVASANPFVTPRLFVFLRELAANNDRAWFNANKQRYLDEVRDPLLGLIEALGAPLRRVAPHLVADASPVGGSLFRIYRDTRFSKDKSPYKTHCGIHFRHAEGKDAHAPGAYLHLEPGQVFVGSGIWHPDAAALGRIRAAIAAHPDRFERATSGVRLLLDEDPERLQRPPRGYHADHPAIEHLKRKSFTASARFTQQDACATDFPDKVTKAVKRASPLLAFLAEALGVDW
jgi:uncharacterized protein (TIGR02453 family)